MSAFGLYVHLPFCATLCPYCDFAVVVGRTDLHERYCGALVEEARAWGWGATATSVFLGGGTPSFVDPALLARTLDRLWDVAPVAPGAEITLEANPESCTYERLGTLRAAGVNRLSIGAQSFDDTVLRALGRTHDASAVRDAVAAARAAGFTNLSLDLIYGGPGETDVSWRATMDAALSIEPDHLSCYALTIEERTAFGRAVARGAMAAPDEDVLARRYETACEALRGFNHYEISNWARPGRESAHNTLYWTQGDYLGLGLGAHSHRAGHRWWNARSIRRYVDDPAGTREGEERLDDGQRAEEWVSLRLRLLEGVPLAEASSRLGRPLDEPAAALAAAGLAEVADGRLVLSARGMLLENEVAARLLSEPAYA